MKVGCQMAFNESTSPQYISEAGALVEELGFHSFWVPEHVLFFPEYESHYPYSDDGRLRGDPKSLLDPLTALTFVSAFTSSIRLCTGICLVPQRNPVYTAKQVADLDYLSNGRVEFGIGIGWLKEEFEALGVPWQDRAGRTLECVEVMKTLWCDEISNFEGKYYSIKAAYQNPKPIQKPHPPLLFGGESLPALKRVASVGQGWYGYNLTPASFEQHLRSLDDLLSDQSRSLSDLLLYVSPSPECLDAESMQAFADLGAQQMVLPLFARDTSRLRDRAQRILEMVNG
ncbi:MAG: LLM class F420-dependent oxidoreductase [Pseudomonadales bacterium]